MISMPIDIKGLQTPLGNKGVIPKTDTSFSNILGQALDKVNESEKTANSMVTDMTTGKTQDLHNVMIAVEKSDILLQTAVEVRNKVIDAYQEIMRMQV